MADIDKASQDFAEAWERVKNKSVNLYSSITNSSDSNAVRAVQIANLDLGKLILDDSDLQKAIGKLGAEHLRILKDTPSFANVDEAYLQALVRIDTQVYIGATGPSGAEIKALMSDSITNNLSNSQFSKALETTGLQKHQANALANDSLRTFERNVTVEQANNSPKDKLFVWSGPTDSRTSAICIQMVGEGALTIEEWRSTYGGIVSQGSHVNCRHTLLPASSN